MNFKLGEFVRFVDEKGEGYITRIIDDQTIAVTDEDGFEVPVLSSKVTRIHRKGDAMHSGPVASDTSVSEFIFEGIFLVFSEDQKAGSVVHFNLANTTSYTLYATATTEQGDSFKGEFHGAIQPKSTVEIYAASLNELDRWPKFHLQIIFFSKENKELKKPIEFSEKFRAKHFSTSKRTMTPFAQPAWVIQLDESMPLIDAKKLKESFFESSPEIVSQEGILKTQVRPERVIDLHIQNLVPDFGKMLSHEILEFQMAHFRKMLDAAIVHKFQSIIFIHGSGNGVLRNEIYKVVSKHPHVKTFMDAQKERFGYGGTEVFLK